MTTNSLEIYYTPHGDIDVQIDYQTDTIWLNKKEIAKLFRIDRSGVSRHINNIFKTGELEQKSNVQKMHIANSDKPVEFFNLDVVLAVGYRANSTEASRFRRWATNVLKQYLVSGYAINEKRLAEKQEQIEVLRNSLNLLTRSITSQAKNIDDAQNLAKVLEVFAKGLGLLDDYDNRTLATKGLTKREAVKITREEYLELISKMKPEFGSDVFANPKDDSFDSSINQIYQTFDGEDCYPTLEEKAAMLLYMLVKNHSFTDGNKRIGAACFIHFLEKNNMLYQNGAPILDNATLFALTLLIASSKPEEKDTMKQVILSVLNSGTNNY
ncbi:MAG: Fic/DOC family protein [Alphaproteobacteria bacterium]|nr:Fic/DOC family protein [Alphaproteobacteria bacterium]